MIKGMPEWEQKFHDKFSISKLYEDRQIWNELKDFIRKLLSSEKKERGQRRVKLILFVLQICCFFAMCMAYASDNYGIGLFFMVPAVAIGPIINIL